MKVARIKQPAGLDHLEVAVLAETRRPGPGEILVQLHASSLNYHDYIVVIGGIKTPEGRIPMSDGAGEVVAAGEGAGFKIGDRVMSTFFPHWIDEPVDTGNFADVPGDRDADGYARSFALVPSTAFTRTPAGYSHEEAATLPCAGLTAWRALVDEGKIKAGDTVLVQGSGGVSVFALQFAKALEATVIATSSSDDKLARLKQLGADYLINYRSEEKWGSVVRELTGDVGVDHVIEIGGAGTLPQSITAARTGGHIALIGILSGVHQGMVPTTVLMAKQLRITGMRVGSHRQQNAMIETIEAAGIRPVIDSRFPLEKIADAFRYQETGGHFGKIVINI